MKKMILIAALALGFTAYAETGVVIVSADEGTIQQTVQQINSGRYRGHLHDSCNGRRKVYSVSIKNGGYRVDRYGNLQPTGPKAVIKYSCNGSDD